MGAPEIMAEARAAGLSLNVEGDGIRVEPRSALCPALRARIIAEKPAILVVLRAEGERHWRFRVTPEGATPFVVHTLPEATVDEARELWPNARVDPLPAPTKASESAAGIQHADLAALVERVARAYRTSQEEFAEMKRLALADPTAAWAAFTATAATEGLR